MAFSFAGLDVKGVLDLFVGKVFAVLSLIGLQKGPGVPLLIRPRRYDRSSAVSVTMYLFFGTSLSLFLFRGDTESIRQN